MSEYEKHTMTDDEWRVVQMTARAALITVAMNGMAGNGDVALAAAGLMIANVVYHTEGMTVENVLPAIRHYIEDFSGHIAKAHAEDGGCDHGDTEKHPDRERQH
jgi:hypothetical protein